MKKLNTLFLGMLIAIVSALGFAGCSKKIIAATVVAEGYTVRYAIEYDKPCYNIYDGEVLIGKCSLDEWNASENGATIASGTRFSNYQLSVRSDYYITKYTVDNQEITPPKALDFTRGASAMIIFGTELDTMPDIIASQFRYYDQTLTEKIIKKDITISLNIKKLDFYDVKKWEMIGTEARKITDDCPRLNEHYLGIDPNFDNDNRITHEINYIGTDSSNIEYCTLFFEKRLHMAVELEFRRTLKRKNDESPVFNYGEVFPPASEDGSYFLGVFNSDNETYESNDEFTFWLGNLCFERELNDGRTAITYYAPVTLK